MGITAQEQFAHSLNKMEEHNKIHKARDKDLWFLKQDKKTLQSIYEQMKV